MRHHAPGNRLMSPTRERPRGEPEEVANTASLPQLRTVSWAGYAACTWAIVFAAVSFYWAVGGTVGVNTNAPAITKHVLARDPAWVAIMWCTGVLKIIAALVALALVQPWGRALPRWLVLIAAWSAVVIMGVYEGAASLIQHALMVAGIISTPAGLGATSARWHLLLWDPWWLVGGILLASRPGITAARRLRDYGSGCDWRRSRSSMCWLARSFNRCSI